MPSHQLQAFATNMAGDDPKPGEKQELTGAPLNTWASFQNEVRITSRGSIAAPVNELADGSARADR